MFKAKAHLLVISVALLTLAGCQTQDAGPDDPGDPPPASPTLALSPASVNVNAGGAPVTFSALVQNSSETVTWTLSGPGSVTPASGPTTTYTPPESVDSAESASLTATLGTTGVTAVAPIAIYPADVTPPPDPLDPPDPPDPPDPDPPDPPPGNPPPGNPPPGNPDTTPPTVVSLEPPPGATGVAHDADIVITFSERMDQAATQAAYRSADLPAGAVTFAWNEAGTVLTVKPNSPLKYANGEDPSTEAKRYSFSLTNTAKDLAGNALVPVASDFTTLRMLENQLAPSQAGLDGAVAKLMGNDAFASSTFPLLYVGDDDQNTSYRSFLSFDLSGVPESVEEVRLVKAELYLYKSGVVGLPYVSLVPCEGNPKFCPNQAAITLEHVNYGPGLEGGDYDTPRLADLGAIDRTFDAETAYLKADVIGAVRDDLVRRSERGERSQYRLSFPLETDKDGKDDFVFFASGDSSDHKPELRLTYLVP